MEFWGVEVKAGESLKVEPEEGQLIHISQVALGDAKSMKGASYVPIRLKINDKKYVLGSLSAESRPQITFDLVFEKDFELSHDWKDGSVYFCGYTADDQDNNEFGDDGFSDEDEEDKEGMQLENGKPPLVELAKPAKSKAASAKPEASAKPKVTLVDAKKEKGNDEEDDSDESDERFEDGDESSDDASDDSDDMSEDDEDDGEDEDEETPKKAEPTKKRPTDSATKTPVPSKKAKLVTPQKSDGKKGGAVHTATPHPKKEAGKQTPKSAGQISCKSCSKTFTSEKGLESHSKAKHGGK